MGARPDPTGLARTNPSASYTQMDDGHSTLLIIDGYEGICFWEKTVKPPGMDGGDPIDTTTMHNQTWRTAVSRSLITMTPCNLTAAYDPEMWDVIVSRINEELLMAIQFPNCDLLGFYGFMQSVEPQDHSEGAQPECNLVIGVTNCDPTDRTEQAPMWIVGVGTCYPGP
jgi:hypothetical protein